MTQDQKEFTGACLCGSVRFSAGMPSLFCAHCHCDFCRKAHGAAFVTWVGVREETFRIHQGEDKLTWHASSKQGRRGFCSRCGSTMLYQSTLSPGEVHIVRANIEGVIDRKPELHVFYDFHVDWVSSSDDLVKLDSENELLSHYKQVET